VKIDKRLIYANLIFNKEIKYNENIVLHPIKMSKIMDFQQFQVSITLYKDSLFQEKDVLKMTYLDFLKFTFRNKEFAEKYGMPILQVYFDFAMGLLRMACGEDAKIEFKPKSLDFTINGEEITPEIFDDIRRIIILQNDIDFDIDEFINKDTLEALEKAKEFEAKKRKEKAEIEDYIDSLIVGLKVTEEYIENMTIRKFWRYIKRINVYDSYKILKTAEYGGMVTLKEPVKDWMTSIDVADKYQNLKADEGELRSKIG